MIDRTLNLMGMTGALRSAASAMPSRVATVFGQRSTTWGDLEEEVAQLAGGLRKLGVQPGDRVAILSRNSDRFTAFQLAVWWAGGAVVPMNVRWSASENAYSLNDAEAQVLFVDKAFSAILPAILTEAKGLKHIVHLDDDEAPEGVIGYSELVDASAPVEDAVRAGEDLAGLYYTGGTTGFPKGVMLPHRALWYNNLVAAKICRVEPESTYLHAAPMFHLADGAISGGVTAMGAKHVYLPAFNPAETVDMIEQHQVSHILLVPTMLAMVLQDAHFEPARFASLELIVYGASPMPEGVLREAIEKLPHVQFVQAYGQTELAPFATFLSPAHHRLGSKKLRSAGRAVPGVELRILDEAGADVQAGHVGEIYVRSPGVMLGYWNLPEQTSETLTEGWVKTGDGGFRDEDGFVFIVDRMKDMIVTGGENVFSAEVESAISSHPAVAEVAVIGIPAETWGEAVHAIIVLRNAASASEEDIISHCRDRIANYKLPRSVTFRDSPLPLSGAGKVLKRDLRDPFWEGVDRKVN